MSESNWFLRIIQFADAALELSELAWSKVLVIIIIIIIIINSIILRNYQYKNFQLRITINC